MDNETSNNRIAKPLSTSRLILKVPQSADALHLKIFYTENAFHLERWTPKRDLLYPAHDAVFSTLLEQWEKERQEGKAVRFLLYSNEPSYDSIIGICAFSQIFRGAFLACYLGYEIDHRYEGKGLMSEALRESIRYMFEEQKLHRIMANYMPQNIRSKRLLHTLGFVVEGFAKHYLKINKQWEDHVLTALSYERWLSLR